MVVWLVGCGAVAVWLVGGGDVQYGIMVDGVW